MPHKIPLRNVGNILQTDAAQIIPKAGSNVEDGNRRRYGFKGLTTRAGRAEWITSLPTKPDDT